LIRRLVKLGAQSRLLKAGCLERLLRLDVDGGEEKKMV